LTVYVLWIHQEDKLGSYNKVSVNEERKDYPEKNLHFQGQYDSLEELRKHDQVTTDCKICGAEIGPDTKIYFSIPPACGECKQKDEVIKNL